MGFETINPAMQGGMTVTCTLADAGDGTDLVTVRGHLPPGLSAADSAFGWAMALD